MIRFARRHFLPLLFLLLPTMVCACTSAVPKADFSQAPALPEGAKPTPVLFGGLQLLLPPGSEIGMEGCALLRYPVSRTALRGAFDKPYVSEAFHDALEAQGYDVAGSIEIVYDAEDEMERADYSVSAKISDVRLDLCHRERGTVMLFFPTRGGDEGAFHIAADWTVYDRLHRKTVYKTRTEGYAARKTPNEEGLALMATDAFEMAAHNLGADPGFRALIADGVMPPREAEEQEQDERPRLFDPQEEVAISPLPLSREAFAEKTAQKARLAVMIQKFGHGSGFFITQEGHILTNAHVVGDALKMRIVMAGRKKALVAEVLRTDRARDVALLRLEEIPADLSIVTLPVRTDWPAVGEEVYAVGAPRSPRLQDTVTKGIVSAHRKAMRFLGTRANFIQADVEIHQGSSGGPLLDRNGNVVGLTVGALSGAESDGIGLNYFIPVGEALAALGIAPPQQ